MLAEEKAGKEIWGLSDKVEKCLLDSHHPNYGKPLEVWHLCKRCHKRLHKIQIENRIAILDLRMAKRLVLKNL
jgi:hypothetical protein